LESEWKAMDGLATTDIGHPLLYSDMRAHGVDVRVIHNESDAFPTSDSIKGIGVTYLFPFFQAVELAARMLATERIRAASIAVVAGSDVWQIGRCAAEATRFLLQSDHTTKRVAYASSPTGQLADGRRRSGALADSLSSTTAVSGARSSSPRGALGLTRNHRSEP
jgi:hypothetical protein